MHPQSRVDGEEDDGDKAEHNIGEQQEWIDGQRAELDERPQCIERTKRYDAAFEIEFLCCILQHGTIQLGL